jgi:hypothetical protein
MAGGYIPLNEQDSDELALQLRQQVLQYLEVPPGTSGKSLI